MKKLKERWNVTSNWQLTKIFIVFAITGYSSLLLAIPFLNMIGIPETFQPHWLYRVLRILLIFPIYQVLLVFIGFVLGEFDFFWQSINHQIFCLFRESKTLNQYIHR